MARGTLTRGVRTSILVAALVAGCGSSGGGGDGATDATTGEVAPYIVPTYCGLPFVAGPCEAAFPVFAFVDGACVERIYGGCSGNANRFTTLEQCLALCDGRPFARGCPTGRHVATICLRCGVTGGCGERMEVCALDCTKNEDCVVGSALSGCFESSCQAFGCD